MIQRGTEKRKKLKALYMPLTHNTIDRTELTTFPQEECIESKARSSTYKSTALSSGSVEVKPRPKSIST